ncbi:MAG: TonB-dependent receptor [Longimicrobiales bacterium]
MRATVVRAVTAAVLGLLGLAGTYGSAAAQHVQGLVLYNHNDLPVVAATVRLLDQEGQVLVTGLTNLDGRFALEVPADGSFLVHVEHITAFEMVDGPIEAGFSGNSFVTFHLVPKPIALEALEVTVEGRSRILDRTGFYQRADEGLGFFMDESAIERRNPIRASDLLRAIPGVQVVSANGLAGFSGYPIMSYTLRTRIDFAEPCFPRVYVDGTVVEQGGTAFIPTVGFDELIQAYDIAAVEVYRSPVEAPPQFGGLNACGLIMLWTKSGLRSRVR